MPKRERKVVLIGAKGYQRTEKDVRVDCFLWDEIKKIKNIRDYDTLILNLLGLQDKVSRQKVSWGSFRSILDFNSARDILQNGGIIIVIGDPRFQVSTEAVKNKAKETSNSKKEQEFLDWIGAAFEWDSEPGDTVHFIDDYEHRQYEEYVSKLDKWQYSLDRCKIDESKLKLHWNLDYFERNGLKIVIKRDYFCYNRYRNALAFTLRYQFVKKGSGYRSDEVVGSFGPIILLPQISLNEEETLQLVLKDICGIETSLPEPEWLSEFVAPGQKTVDEEIRRIQGELQNIVESLDKAKGKKEESRKCLKLLYEREYGLEPVVRDILRGFGAHVEDPSEENKEDGWVVVKLADKTYEGVLEVKSTKSDQFNEDGRKQLLDWIDRGRTLREKNYKGIFIGNSAVDKPIKERPWAFSDSWEKAAELSEICAMKTEDLYFIHLLNSRGLIEIDDFWKEVFTTNGIFDMKRYWELHTTKATSD